MMAVNATDDPDVFTTTDNNTGEPRHTDKGYYIDDIDDAWNDVQVLLIACFFTLLPLVVLVFIGFVARLILLRIYNKRKSSSFDGMLERDATSGSINKPLHSLLLNSDKPSSDTNLDLSIDEVDLCESTILNTTCQIRSNHSSTNGSIITMTLKNNHLIVETEERNDIEADSRETTMKYSPSARDGIFIVEVQQGVRSTPSTVNLSDQRALVHTEPSPPRVPQGLQTGLSQSNASLTHPSYTYTNQKGYDNEGYGYNLYNGYLNDLPPKKLHKLRITSAVYKNPSKSLDLDAPPQDGFLLSDVEAADRLSQPEQQQHIGAN